MECKNVPARRLFDATGTPLFIEPFDMAAQDRQRFQEHVGLEGKQTVPRQAAFVEWVTVELIGLGRGGARSRQLGSGHIALNDAERQLEMVFLGHPSFALLQIKLSTTQGAGGTQRYKAKAMDTVLTGRMMDAAEAKRAGLAARVLPLVCLQQEAFAAAMALPRGSRHRAMLSHILSHLVDVALLHFPCKIFYLTSRVSARMQ